MDRMRPSVTAIHEADTIGGEITAA